ncbi:MAG: substrate-binding domain-containing protein [Acidimicrobiales bacterium]
MSARARRRTRVAPYLPSARRSVGATVLLLLAIILLLGGMDRGSGAAAADDPVPVVLKGEGTWGPYRELVPWQDALYGAEAPIDLQYTSTGSQLGRQDFLAGNLDYVLSGVPFSDAELAQLKGGKGSLIDVPIQVEAMSFLLAVPTEGFESLDLVCDPYDPDTPDPDACIVRTPYDGPIRVPNENLAAMAFRYAGSGDLPANSWNHPDVLAAMDVPNFTLPLQAGPAPVMRSEPSGTNYFLQLFAKEAAPTTWAGLKASDSAVQWEPITERLPRLAGASRQGVDQQSLQLGLAGADPVSGGITSFSKGIMADVPPSAKGAVAEAFPTTKTVVIEVQNGAGEWVAPTPETISKAVELGGDAPLHALTNEDAGAYPLVWVNHLYAPAKGLSAEKTEALATTIRYLATDGQSAAAPVGEGKLSTALVAKALQGADALVASNCVGSDRKIVTSSDPGPYAPDLPGMKAIGPMKHCETVGATTTTTAATTTTVAPYVPDTTPYFDPGVTDPGTFDDGSSLGAGDGGATTETTAPAKPTTTVAPTTSTTIDEPRRPTSPCPCRRERRAATTGSLRSSWGRPGSSRSVRRSGACSWCCSCDDPRRAPATSGAAAERARGTARRCCGARRCWGAAAGWCRGGAARPGGPPAGVDRRRRDLEGLRPDRHASDVPGPPAPPGRRLRRAARGAPTGPGRRRPPDPRHRREPRRGPGIWRPPPAGWPWPPARDTGPGQARQLGDRGPSHPVGRALRRPLQAGPQDADHRHQPVRRPGRVPRRHGEAGEASGPASLPRPVAGLPGHVGDPGGWGAVR